MKDKRYAFRIFLFALLLTAFLSVPVFAEEPAVLPEVTLSSENRAENPENVLLEVTFSEKKYRSERPDIPYLTVEEGGLLLKNAFLSHEESLTFGIFDSQSYSTDRFYEITDSLYALALAHDGVGAHGDYLRYNGCAVHFSGTVYGTSENAYYVLNASLSYYTTKEQEDALTEKLAAIYSSFRFTAETPDFVKINTIYDYLCKNVTYDYTHLQDETYMLQYTSYAAIVSGTSVCQGYATSFYRMCLDNGLSARVITGIGGSESHGWNIVRLGEYYYNMDATWDAGIVPGWNYRLKSAADFKNHTREDRYNTPEYHAAHPMAKTSFLSRGGTVDAANLLITEELTMNLYASLSGNTGGVYLQVRTEDQVFRVTEKVKYGLQYYYSFVIPPNCFSEKYSLSLWKDGVSLTKETDYSVKTYASALSAKYPDDKKLLRLISDLLNYGAMAQKYSHYHETDLPNDLPFVSEYQSVYSEIHETGTSVKTEDAHRVFGAMLVLNNKVSLQFAVKNTDGEKMTVRFYRITDAGDVYLSSAETSEDMELLLCRDLYYYELRDYFRADLQRGDTVISSVTYSALCYLTTVQDTSGDIDLLNLCRALYCYSESCLLYR